MTSPVRESAAAAAASSDPVKPPISVRHMKLDIEKIEDLQIELIGLQIALAVEKNLGYVGKARAAQLVMQKKGSAVSAHENILFRQTMMHAKMEMGKPFLSNIQAAQFQLGALWPIKKAIANSFSTAEQFLESGLCFKLSDYEPMGFLKEVAEKIALELNLTHVPPKYYVYLRLDRELTQEKSDLVFVLTEESEGVEFTRKNFSLSELEQELSNSKL